MRRGFVKTLFAKSTPPPPRRHVCQILSWGCDRVTYCDILPRSVGGVVGRGGADQNSPGARRGLTIAVLMGWMANGAVAPGQHAQ